MSSSTRDERKTDVTNNLGTRRGDQKKKETQTRSSRGGKIIEIKNAKRKKT